VGNRDRAGTMWHLDLAGRIFSWTIKLQRRGPGPDVMPTKH
jgi:hypothetical protein